MMIYIQLLTFYIWEAYYDSLIMYHLSNFSLRSLEVPKKKENSGFLT